MQIRNKILPAKLILNKHILTVNMIMQHNYVAHNQTAALTNRATGVSLLISYFSLDDPWFADGYRFEQVSFSWYLCTL